MHSVFGDCIAVLYYIVMIYVIYSAVIGGHTLDQIFDISYQNLMCYPIDIVDNKIVLYLRKKQ